MPQMEQGKRYPLPPIVMAETSPAMTNLKPYFATLTGGRALNGLTFRCW